ncbi:hypothetical protein OV079_51815 [Nannocystis pusilla]|uniref:Uncharacterized protein n=1 Tax=Nannocystis pusilla TaxID=889268 RepID=A0A9X3F0N8_9BACT|nr:hypothetical protein [Nannocystis pusilla]MCY1013879.1 hypothetical protein [Nannocystis pusilla]
MAALVRREFSPAVGAALVGEGGAVWASAGDLGPVGFGDGAQARLGADAVEVAAPVLAGDGTRTATLRVRYATGALREALDEVAAGVGEGVGVLVFAADGEPLLRAGADAATRGAARASSPRACGSSCDRRGRAASRSRRRSRRRSCWRRSPRATATRR